MISSYIANLQLRIQSIDVIIGGIEEYNEDGVKEIKQKTSEFISKLHKDNQRKFDRIKKMIEKYGDVLDGSTNMKQKLNIVCDEIEELKAISSTLDKIEKQLPVLNSETYTKIRPQSQTSELEINENSDPNKVNVKCYDERSLVEIKNEHREEINQLFELNKRVVGNLNAKLQALLKKKSLKGN